MSDQSPLQFDPPSEPTLAGAGAIALFVILVLVSAFLSLGFWFLGAGIPRVTHNVMGVLFAVINVSCFGAGIWHLRNRERLAAVLISIAPLPLCVAALVVAVYVFRI